MGGKKKSSKVKPATATSVFSGVKNSYTNLPGFGSASSIVDPKTGSITNSFAPDEQVSTILGAAKQGIQDNQSIFNLTPEQQFSQVESNPYYQYAQQQNRRFLDTEQGEARQAASRFGLENSTIAGAIEATLMNDAAQQDMLSRLSAIDYSRALAGENLGVQQGLMNQIYGYTMDPTQMANQTLLSAGNSQDQTSMFNASQIQNANQFNAQLAQQAAARRGSLIGNLIGAVGTIGGAALGGPLGAKIGGSIGGLAKGFIGK